ncbi:hypothetical protein LAZ67_9001243, partial [Cordylochernes scorpioides]
MPPIVIKSTIGPTGEKLCIIEASLITKILEKCGIEYKLEETVQSKKRTRGSQSDDSRSPTRSERNLKTPRMDIDEQSPATGVSQQMNAAHPPQDDEENNDNDGPWTTVTNVKKPRIPPVIAENVADWKLLCQELKDLCMEPFQVTISGKKHIIKSKNIGDFKKIREYVQKNNGGYSYRLQEEKPLKVVLKGVSTAFKEEDVVTELVSIGFTEVIVKRLHRQSTKIPMNIVLVELPKNEQNKRIYGITKILYQKIVVESFRTTKRVTRCFNCQGFGHGQLNCFLKPKCVKYAEEHHSKDCPRKSKQLPPKCANCGEAHTANYRGCPNFPKPQQQQLKPPRQNSLNTIPQVASIAGSSLCRQMATIQASKMRFPQYQLQGTLYTVGLNMPPIVIKSTIGPTGEKLCIIEASLITKILEKCGIEYKLEETVQSKKRTRGSQSDDSRSPTRSERNLKTPRMDIDEQSPATGVSQQMNAAHPPQDDEENNDNDGPWTTVTNVKKPRIPPVIAENVADWKLLCQELKDLCMEPFQVTISGKKHIIKSKNIGDFKKIREYVQKNNGGYSYRLQEEKPLKVVLKGVSTAFKEEDVVTELVSIGFTEVIVKRLHRQSTKIPMNIVLVELPKNEQNKRIYGITEILYQKIVVESFRTTKRVTQCFNCQGFGHGQLNCFLKPKCVKYAEEHHSKDCPRKSKQLPPKCANCGEAHTANYRGCPNFPKPQQQQLKPPRQNSLNTIPQVASIAGSSLCRQMATIQASKMRFPQYQLQGTLYTEKCGIEYKLEETVQSKKRTRGSQSDDSRSPTRSERNLKTPRMDIDEQSPATGVSQQMNAAHPPQDDEENNDNDGPWTTVTNVKKPRIPPVIAENVADWKLLCQELKDLCMEPFQVTISGKKHIIKSKNIGDLKKIREYVQKNNGGYSYRLQEEKPLKVVLKGVSTAFKEEDVVTELVSIGFTEVIVKRLHRQSTKIPMNIVLVELPKNEQNKRIYGITEILYQKIVVESFRTTKRVTQCFNCQGFGHGQLNCFLKPKCVKYAEEHHSKDCPRKSKQLPPKCANCGEAHTANYRGCPNFPKPQQQQLKPPRQNSLNTIPQVASIAGSSLCRQMATIQASKMRFPQYQLQGTLYTVGLNMPPIVIKSTIGPTGEKLCIIEASLITKILEKCGIEYKLEETVQSKKRTRGSQSDDSRSPTRSERNLKTPRMDIDEQSPATGVSQQMNAAHPPQDDEENNDNDGPWTTVTNVKKPRIPPVIAENVADWKLLCQELKDLCLEPFQVTISGKKHIIKSKNIGDFKKIRETTKRVTQCFNCQGFGHGQLNCFLKPKCVKYAEEHHSKDCPRKSKQLPPKCANCGEAHTANYRGCPNFPKPQQQQLKPPRQNSLNTIPQVSSTKTEEAIVEKQKASYAETAKNKTTHSDTRELCE